MVCLNSEEELLEQLVEESDYFLIFYTNLPRNIKEADDERKI